MLPSQGPVSRRELARAEISLVRFGGLGSDDEFDFDFALEGRWTSVGPAHVSSLLLLEIPEILLANK
jgi:hypothetical protein